MKVPVSNQTRISSVPLPVKKLFKQETGKPPAIKISSWLPSASYHFILCNFFTLFFPPRKIFHYWKHWRGSTSRSITSNRMPMDGSTYPGQTELPETIGWGWFLQFILSLLPFIGVSLFPSLYFFFFSPSGAVNILGFFIDFYTSEIIRCS